MLPTKGVYLPISKLQSILAVANLLAHNNKSQICYCCQISIQNANNCSFSETFILLTMVRIGTWRTWRQGAPPGHRSRDSAVLVGLRCGETHGSDALGQTGELQRGDADESNVCVQRVICRRTGQVIEWGNIMYICYSQGLLYHRTCKSDFLCRWPSLNFYLK